MKIKIKDLRRLIERTLDEVGSDPHEQAYWRIETFVKKINDTGLIDGKTTVAILDSVKSILDVANN